MSRLAGKSTGAAAALRHYRRAAIAGGLIVALLLALLLEEQAPRGDAGAALPTESALFGHAATAADPAAPTVPAPRIMSISIPPLPPEEGAPPPATAVDLGTSEMPLGPSGSAAVTAPATEPPATGEGASVIPAAGPPPTPSPPPTTAISPPSTAISPPPPPGNGYFIQLGVFGAQANAEALRLELAANGTPAYLESRVVVGPYPTRKAAEAARAELRSAGHPDGLLVPPRKP